MTSIRVEDDVLDRFRTAVVAKHGRLRGVLRDEATQALEDHARRLEEEG